MVHIQQRTTHGLAYRLRNHGFDSRALANFYFAFGTFVKFNYYLECKREEWKDYHDSVSQWELERYLQQY